MSVLRRLTVAQIRGSKSRFVVTVIGVMLSAAYIVQTYGLVYTTPQMAS